MTKTTTQPREFDLTYSGLSGAWTVRNFNNYHGNDDEYVTVIEHSAYLQLQEERAKDRAALDACFGGPRSVPDFELACERARARLKEGAE